MIFLFKFREILDKSSLIFLINDFSYNKSKLSQLLVQNIKEINPFFLRIQTSGNRLYSLNTGNWNAC